MKAPEYKGPVQLVYGKYAANCKLITLPKGYRFLKLGEKSKGADFHTPFGKGRWENNKEAMVGGDVIKGRMWPQIRKVDYVRDPKGRFVNTKPAPPTPKVALNKEMISWVASLSADEIGYIRNCVAEFKKFLDGEATAIMSLPWRETGNSDHWNKLYDGEKPTEADKEYVRACIELWEARAKEVAPKVVPTPKLKKEKPLVTIYAEGTGPSRKYRVEHGGAQLEEGDKELLKGIDTFCSARKELADLKAWKAKVLAAI